MAKYIILDTETTGASTEDRIIQLGFMVLGKPSEHVAVYNDYCSSEVPIKIEAMEVHNIVPEMLEGKPPCAQTAAFQALNTLNSSENYLLIHNAPFDLGMLEKEGFVPKMQVIDTLRCAKHLFGQSPRHRLQYFRYDMKLYTQEAQEAQKLGIEVKAHDAIGDVLVLKLFMTKLVEACKAQFPNDKPMQKLVELTKTPVFISTFRFGKHKGKNVRDVAQQDRGYLEWMLGNMTDLDEDMRYTLQQVLL